jgi:benzoate/toluate 1,2-dioxygenase reductase subunit
VTSPPTLSAPIWRPGLASPEACKTRGQTYRARLYSVEKLSETTIAFSLDTADAVIFPPGQ